MIIYNNVGEGEWHKEEACIGVLDEGGLVSQHVLNPSHGQHHEGGD